MLLEELNPQKEPSGENLDDKREMVHGWFCILTGFAFGVGRVLHPLINVQFSGGGENLDMRINRVFN